VSRRGPALAIALLALLALCVPAATAQRVTPRIVGGTAASPGEYPAQALVYQPVSQAFCGGTLIGARQVLTAAHCVVEESSGELLAPGAFAVYLGENDLQALGSEEEFDVVAVDIHEAYGTDSSGHGNDVAMLTLDRDPEGDAANPGVLRLPLVGPDQASLWAPTTAARIIGWGTTSSGGDPSDDLLEANVPIVSDSTCRSDYAVDGITIDSNTMVCAGDGIHDTCQGDSGGPLMVDDGHGAFVLVGVVSFGIGCADPDFPGVYARIGDEPLNAWVRGRLNSVDFSQAGAATAGQSVSFTATAGPGVTDLIWDFDGDGFVDATGPTVSHTFPTAGSRAVIVEGTDADGYPAYREHTVSVAAAPLPPPPPPAGDVTAPVISSASLSSGAFAVNRRGASERPVVSAKAGTTFRYSLSEAARVVFTIEQALPGRRSGRSCVKPTRKNRSKRRCTRVQLFGRFAVASKAQSNSKSYSGRIGRKAMKPGSYTAKLVATDAAGNASAAKTLKLKVVR
jgi:secreted trypsin-like serine protease